MGVAMSAVNTTRQTAEVRPTPAVSRRCTWRWWSVGGGLALVLLVAVVSWPAVQATKHRNAARQFLEQGDPTAALASLQAVAQLQPTRAEVQYLLAVTHCRTGQIEPFRSALQLARKSGWPVEDIERQEWLAVAQLGDVEAVCDRLLATIDRGAPDQAAEEIYEALARGYSTAYRLRDAWQCLHMWQQWRPDAPQARLLRAYLYEQLDQIPAAVQDYRAALERLPQDRETHLKLAELLLGQGSTEPK
ncbi:MAG: tetratricopeptide repeat protein [Planctomycetota bacterium]|nr:tetratricopeptide repeat protein [Planctomycetota bacterium]